MAGVVVFGTGTRAQIPGIKVAGKTGTAELEDTEDEEGNPTGGGPETTDAWFTAYAPIGKPKIAVAALFVRNGAGGRHGRAGRAAVLQAGLEARGLALDVQLDGASSSGPARGRAGRGSRARAGGSRCSRAGT